MLLEVLMELVLLRAQPADHQDQRKLVLLLLGRHACQRVLRLEAALGPPGQVTGRGLADLGRTHEARRALRAARQLCALARLE